MIFCSFMGFNISPVLIHSRFSFQAVFMIFFLKFPTLSHINFLIPLKAERVILHSTKPGAGY